MVHPQCTHSEFISDEVNPRQQLVLEADLSHPKYLLGSCCIPTCVGEPCSCSESRETPMAWDPDGIGKPQLSVTLHWLLTLPGSGKKTSHGFLFVCKINKYGGENIFLRLRSMEKSAGKVGTHPDKQQFWYECDCFKSCAQLVCASQVAPLRLISAILFVDLVSGRKFGRNSRY